MPDWNPQERELAMSAAVIVAAVIAGVVFAAVLSWLSMPWWGALLLAVPFLLALRWSLGYLQDNFPK